MARKPRIEIEGGLYHVISRGNNRKKIFGSDDDNVRFLHSLALQKSKLPFYLYAYCLMPNHIHLLIEMQEDPISRIMHRLLTTYSQYYNRKYGTIGHVFQGRYKSILCQSDLYLGTLVRYIHLNPVRAKIVSTPEEHVFSGHLAYLGVDRSGLVDAEPVLRCFGARKSRAVDQYRRFVEAGAGQNSQQEYYRAAEGRMLGSEEFVERMQHRIGDYARKKKGRYEGLSFDVLLAAAERVSGIDRERFCSAAKTRSIVKVKEAIIVLGHEIGLKNRDLAEGLGIDPSAVSKRRDAGRLKWAASEKTTASLLEALRSELID